MQFEVSAEDPTVGRLDLDEGDKAVLDRAILAQLIDASTTGPQLEDDSPLTTIIATLLLDPSRRGRGVSIGACSYQIREMADILGRASMTTVGEEVEDFRQLMLDFELAEASLVPTSEEDMIRAIKSMTRQEVEELTAYFTGRIARSELVPDSPAELLAELLGENALDQPAVASGVRHGEEKLPILRKLGGAIKLLFLGD